MIPDCTVSHASDTHLSRRGFLAVGAAVGGGLVLSLSLPLGRSEAADSEGFTPNAFIRIGGDFNSQSIPLLKSDLPLQYDMVLDQSVRYNPNLKARIWQDLMQIAGPLLKVPAGQQILLKGLKFSEFPTQLVQEIQQAVAQAPPPPPKGRQAQGKQEDPQFTQAKIQKIQAETQRTLAETRKLDSDSKLGMANLAVDAITKNAEHRHRMAEHQHKMVQHQHKVLTDRVTQAREMLQSMQPPAQDQQPPQQAQPMMQQPQPEMCPNQ